MGKAEPRERSRWEESGKNFPCSLQLGGRLQATLPNLVEQCFVADAQPPRGFSAVPSRLAQGFTDEETLRSTGRATGGVLQGGSALWGRNAAQRFNPRRRGLMNLGL